LVVIEGRRKKEEGIRKKENSGFYAENL